MKNIIFIRVVDTIKYPGARYRNDGPDSGEEFRETTLEPSFLKARENNSTLFIDLDGAPGYATSFLDESFGNLARKYGDKFINNIEIKCDDEPHLVKEIFEYMKEK